MKLEDEVMNFYKDKRVLVTGGCGMIGQQLVPLLVKAGAIVRIADIARKPFFNGGTTYLERDLSHMSNCLEVCKDQDYLFHLMGVKGSPRMTKKRPADFFVPMVQCNTNVLEAARLAGVERFLYTSSIAVLFPDMDKFPAWAKKTGEMQIEAYRIQHGMKNLTIVRPANIYGPGDNFEDPDAMVVTSLVKRISEKRIPFEMWGDGSQERDFIYSRDAADAMMTVMEKNPQEPINIGTGETHTVKELTETLMGIAEWKPVITWMGSHAGDQRKLLTTRRLEDLGWKPKYTFEQGLRETFESYNKK